MKRQDRREAFSLIECVTYIAVLVVVIALAYSAFYRCLKGSRDLRRNADEIVQTVRVGERWRDDVHRATGPVRVDSGTLRIPQGKGEIVYSFVDGVVWRGMTTVLHGVKTSQMQRNQRQYVGSWRWELELVSTEPTPRVRPMFSFEAADRRQP